jgi:hypothetical protein
MRNLVIMHPKMGPPAAAACRDATEINLSGRPIMHRRPFSVKQIIALPMPVPSPVF